MLSQQEDPALFLMPSLIELNFTICRHHSRPGRAASGTLHRLVGASQGKSDRLVFLERGARESDAVQAEKGVDRLPWSQVRNLRTNVFRAYAQADNSGGDPA